MKKVFIDANILFYKIISDLFFDASILGAVAVYWSEEVIAEYLKHGPRVLSDISKVKGKELVPQKCKDHVERKIALYRKYSGFTIVKNYSEVTVNEDAINDKNDLHVYKAAKLALCDILVTNDNEFKNVQTITDIEIVAKKADEFFCDLYEELPDVVMDIILRSKAGIEIQRNKSIDLEDFIDEMKRGKLTKLALLIS